MAANIFGLTAESVRRHHFPHADAWVASSRPSLATVVEIIEEEAAFMAGALALEDIVASAITDTSSSAYASCRKTLRLQVAAKLARTIPGADTDLARAWDEAVLGWYERLGRGGATFLGDGASSTGTSNPDGPTTHIDQYGLTVDAAEDMSTVVPRLRRDDAL